MLTKAKQLIKNNELEKAQVLLFDLLDKNPENAEVNYYTASTYDAQGNERAAIPLYEQALTQNIEGDLRTETYIQIGSSYRCIGEYEKAKRVLSRGLEEFPNNLALQIFLAMTSYNLSEGKDAVSMLVKALTKSSADPWIKKYEGALQFYAENLDETW